MKKRGNPDIWWNSLTYEDKQKIVVEMIFRQAYCEGHGVNYLGWLG